MKLFPYWELKQKQLAKPTSHSQKWVQVNDTKPGYASTLARLNSPASCRPTWSKTKPQLDWPNSAWIHKTSDWLTISLGYKPWPVPEEPSLRQPSACMYHSLTPSFWNHSIVTLVCIKNNTNEFSFVLCRCVSSVLGSGAMERVLLNVMLIVNVCFTDFSGVVGMSSCMLDDSDPFWNKLVCTYWQITSVRSR